MRKFLDLYRSAYISLSECAIPWRNTCDTSISIIRASAFLRAFIVKHVFILAIRVELVIPFANLLTFYFLGEVCKLMQLSILIWAHRSVQTIFVTVKIR